MLDVKEAALKASEYFAGLYPVENASNVQLEEVELTDDSNYWFITLSYPESDFMFNSRRKYKVFKIDAKTGQVVSMKIRKVD